MIILMDIGNTTISIASINNINVNKEYEIINIKKINTMDLKHHSIKLDNELKDLNLSDVQDVIISSVVPSINDLFVTYFKSFNIIPLFIESKMNQEIEILLEKPEELGSDLYCLAHASRNYYDKCIIVDLGTATKFLVVDHLSFLGGAISFGFEVAFNALFTSAELLNSIKLTNVDKVVENSTSKCIRSGMIIGMASLVNGMVDKIKKEQGDIPVLLTGGNAEYVKDHFNFNYKYVPNLIFEGMVRLYDAKHS